MDFRLTDDQRALRAGVRELLEGRFPRERLRAVVDGGEPAVDRALWRELGGAGFFALRLAEADGGVGLGLPEAALAFEEAGRALLPGPLVATHLAAGVVEGAAEGRAVVTALDAARGAEPGAAGPLVEHLASADAVLVIGDDEGDRRVGVLPAAGLARSARPIRSVDPATPLHRLDRLHRLDPGGCSGGGPPTAAARLRREAVLLTAALQLGSAARTVEMAVRHAGERFQFGRAIGTFQAVQHLCAGMLVRAETARSMVYAAAVTEDADDVAAAKLLADEAAVRNARDCLQVHGGMGFTWEADVHLHLKRAWVRAGQWQTAAEAEEGLAAGLLRPGV
ncbi:MULTISPECIES: acyl-CoA dehydrogenase family protein [Streptomyces]|uniref:Acyl-CoA dehydrogenase family protein n=1 Tax=Streptomyces lonegramiae TaxID=3075524 RepID=A0ABU2XK10_9ACTN|nr:acyl-CoA dehydrogenase family protein [Streptomyces sp. DSM 41529]MDT0546263.1 acyl-CoA dehydrogenase family protein [Streptomyces sp. DSM 41529]